MLTPEQIAARKGKLTASRVACLVSGDKQKIYDLWREMTDDPSYVPEPPSEDLEWWYALGLATEPVHLDWLERAYGPISRRGEVVSHPTHSWAAATLDGWVNDMPVECKHVGGYEKRETVVNRYMPQMHWQAFVTGRNQCMFSAIEGNRKPNPEIITMDAVYGDELFERALVFMGHVNNRTPPVALDPIAAPVKPTKEYDMSKSNSWSDSAAKWLANKQGAEMFNDAVSSLKELTPADAVKATGHGIVSSRDKAGRIKIGVVK